MLDEEDLIVIRELSSYYSEYPVFLVYSESLRMSLVMKIFPLTDNELGENKSAYKKSAYSLHFSNKHIITCYDAQRRNRMPLKEIQPNPFGYVLTTYAPYGTVANALLRKKHNEMLVRTYFK